MKFCPTPLRDCYLIQYTPRIDERGTFTRTFCQNEIKKQGIDFQVAQCNTSVNREKGTLRGMHFQRAPHEEAKIVSCSSGAMYDVVLDLRRDSPTYKKWAAFELSADSNSALYIPKGFAHGFQTLLPETVVLYWMSQFYDESLSSGVRWNDAAFQITWPNIAEITMSEKDKKYPNYL